MKIDIVNGKPNILGLINIHDNIVRKHFGGSNSISVLNTCFRPNEENPNNMDKWINEIIRYYNIMYNGNENSIIMGTEIYKLRKYVDDNL